MSLTDHFDAGAARYDLLVGLNPGYHAALDSSAQALAQRMLPAHAASGVTLARHAVPQHWPPAHATPESKAFIGGTPLRVLDLGCGSGESTAALTRALPGTVLQGLDASAGMLAQARRKRWPASVAFGQGICGELDVDAVGRSAWHGVHAAYLFRNVPLERRDAALREVWELLAPGGWLVTQEYSVAGDPRAVAVWEAVSRGVISPLAAALDPGNGELYSYLRRSVRAFDSTERFAGRLHTAGFVDVARQDVRGWQHGILHTFRARKAA